MDQLVRARERSFAKTAIDFLGRRAPASPARSRAEAASVRRLKSPRPVPILADLAGEGHSRKSETGACSRTHIADAVARTRQPKWTISLTKAGRASRGRAGSRGQGPRIGEGRSACRADGARLASLLAPPKKCFPRGSSGLQTPGARPRSGFSLAI